MPKENFPDGSFEGKILPTFSEWGGQEIQSNPSPRFLPTIFPLLIDKIGSIVLIIVTGHVNPFTKLLKSFMPTCPLLISRSKVRSLHGPPKEFKELPKRQLLFFFVIPHSLQMLVDTHTDALIFHIRGRKRKQPGIYTLLERMKLWRKYTPPLVQVTVVALVS